MKIYYPILLKPHRLNTTIVGPCAIAPLLYQSSSLVREQLTFLVRFFMY